MKDFTGLVEPVAKRPKAAFWGKGGTKNILRDNFTISTWLAFGAVAQGVLFLIVGRPALIPAFLLLVYRAFDTYAMTVGWKHNKYMDGVIMSKFSAQIPNELGEYGSQPAAQDVVVFLIGTRCNHPMGLLAPGFKDFGAYFPSMAKKLEEHADEFGYLGMTSWLNASARDSGSEIMSVAYFRSIDGLQRFAHSPHHRSGWEWWNLNMKKYPHLSIFHETYHVPKGHYETIWGQSHVSGLASVTSKFTDSVTGGDMWASPIVDAQHGLLKTSGGRMNRSKGDEHDNYEKTQY